MNIDQENQAGQVLSMAKARRPNWLRFAAKRTPSWFSGRELDVLEQGERDRLYTEVAPGFQAGWSILFVVFAANGSNIARGLHLAGERRFWIALMSVYVLVALGAWLYKRRAVLVAARRCVRERGDWPLRSQRHAA